MKAYESFIKHTDKVDLELLRAVAVPPIQQDKKPVRNVDNRNNVYEQFKKEQDNAELKLLREILPQQSDNKEKVDKHTAFMRQRDQTEHQLLLNEMRNGDAYPYSQRKKEVDDFFSKFSFRTRVVAQCGPTKIEVTKVTADLYVCQCIEIISYTKDQVAKWRFGVSDTTLEIVDPQGKKYNDVTGDVAYSFLVDGPIGGVLKEFGNEFQYITHKVTADRFEELSVDLFVGHKEDLTKYLVIALQDESSALTF